MNQRCSGKTHIFLIAVAIAPAIGLTIAAALASGPSPSATQPSHSPNAALLPSEYQILRTRNIFALGAQNAAQPIEDRAGTPASYAFKGAVRAGEQLVAFVQNLEDKSVLQLAVGDAIAGSRITSIDLDAMELASGDRTQRIEIGHRLDGEIAPPTPPASLPSTAPSPATNPATNLSAGEPPTVSGNADPASPHRHHSRQASNEP